jgi:RNA recognition motif-containing protein
VREEGPTDRVISSFNSTHCSVTIADALRRHFSKWGHVSNAQILMNHNNTAPKSRGFGFVTFSDEATALDVLGV